jgi:hypothetical protein
MPAPQLNSYPTHTRTSHPGWYSRLTYLHSYPEVFNTWDDVNGEYYDMFADQFSKSTVRKGNYQWPAGYWKPGVHQRIKGAFEIASDEDKFDMTVGIANPGPGILSAEQNNGTSHAFQTDGFTCLVHFEWNICSGPPAPVDGSRYNYITIYGFYHYEDSESDSNSKYHHIPFRNKTESYRCNDTVTWPYMLIQPAGRQEIKLYNLTIEELGG